MTLEKKMILRFGVLEIEGNHKMIFAELKKLRTAELGDVYVAFRLKKKKKKTRANSFITCC